MTDLEKLKPLAGLPFAKMTGTGNDFIVIDGRKADIPKELRPLLSRAVCRRRRSVGADGLVILEPGARIDPAKGKIDFVWDFFNADGSVAEMCGNCGRCVARFAHDRGLAGSEMAFDTVAGPIRAMIKDSGGHPLVMLEMTRPFGRFFDLELDTKNGGIRLDGVNTGVPHVVVSVEDLEGVAVRELGRELRFHEHFQPAGTNVNFAMPKDSELMVRTYERGVEDETLACGTGAVAAALVAGWKGWLKPPVTVKVRSGESLAVYFDHKEDEPSEVYLEGAADYVYEGELLEDAFNWIAY